MQCGGQKKYEMSAVSYLEREHRTCSNGIERRLVRLGGLSVLRSNGGGVRGGGGAQRGGGGRGEGGGGGGRGKGKTKLEINLKNKKNK